MTQSILYINSERYDVKQKYLPIEHLRMSNSSEDFVIGVIADPILWALGTYLALSLASRVISYSANIASFSHLIPSFPSWARKATLILLPFTVGFVKCISGLITSEMMDEMQESNTGLAYLYIAGRIWPLSLRIMHNLYTQQFYVSATKNYFDGKVRIGDFPSHVAIRDGNVSCLKQLLELAKETLTSDQIQTYLTHANDQGDTIRSIAMRLELASELEAILSDLELADLVHAEDL